MASLNDTDKPLGDLFLDLQFEEFAALQSFPGKIIDHRSHAQVPSGKLDDHITGGKLDLRMDHYPALLQELIHIPSGAGVFLQTDQRHLCQLTQRNDPVLILPEFVSRHKDILYGAHGINIHFLMAGHR